MKKSAKFEHHTMGLGHVKNSKSLHFSISMYLSKNMIARFSELKVTPFIAPSINTAFNDASAGEILTKKAMCQLQLWEH